MPADNNEPLTISDMVVLHLSNYVRHSEEYFVPYAMVQGGIADALKIYRSEVSRTLNKLKDLGYVGERMTHVEGIKRRLKIYFLTETGITLSESIRDRVKSRKIRLKLPSGEVEVPLAEAEKHLPRKVPLLDIIRNSSDGIFDATAVPKAEEERPVEGKFAPPLIGRERELQILKLLLSELRAGRGSGVVITGEAGIGKTRLVGELKALCKDLNFLEGNCLYQTGADPYLPFIDLINAYLQGPKGQALKGKSARGPSIAALSSLLLASRATTEPGQRQEQDRIRIFEYIASTLVSISNEKPTIVFIDDLHWADAGTIHLFHYLSRNVRHNPLMIIGAYRPEEVALDPEHPIHEVLTRMRKEEIVREISLDRLNLEETGKLVASHLDRDDTPEEFVKAIYRETEGNPFFIEEVLDSMKDESVIRAAEDDWKIPQAIKVPSSVSETLMRRLGKLTKDDRNLLEIAAVIGDRFSLDFLLDVLGNEEKVLDSVDRLKKANLIEEEQGEKELYRFHHDKIKEVVYNELSRPKAKFLHERVAETLESLYKDNNEEAVTSLAYHYMRTGLHQKAYEYSMKAAEKAEKLHTHQAAITFYNGALDALDSMLATHRSDAGDDLPASGPSTKNEILDKDFFEDALDPSVYLKNRKAEVLLRQGDNYLLLAQVDKSRAKYEEAFILTKDLRKRALVYSKIAGLLRKAGSYEEGLRYCAKALEWIEGVESEEAALVHNAAGLIHFSKGDVDRALEHCERGLGIMRRIEDGKTVATILNTLGILYHHKCDYGSSLESFEKSAAIREMLKDERGLASNYTNIGNHYLYMGDYQKALEYCQKSSLLYEKVGDVCGLANVLNNMGMIHQKRHELDKALEHFQKSLELSEKVGEAPTVALISNNMGDLHCKKKEYGKALEHYRKSAELSKKFGFEAELVNSLMGMAEVHLERNEYDEALINISESIRFSRRMGRIEVLAFCLRTAGRIYREKGELNMSKESLLEALELFQKTGNELEIGKTLYERGLTLRKMKDKHADEQFESAMAMLAKFKDDHAASEMHAELAKLVRRK